MANADPPRSSFALMLAAAHKHGWTLVSADLKDLVEPGLAVAPDKAR
jgi:hypothetical protein